MDPWKDDNTTGITTESTTITAKLEQATAGENGDYYALVILNNETSTGTKVTLPSGSTTYGTWNAATTDATNLLDNTKGFYMANAPQFTAAGVEPSTLVHIKVSIEQRKRHRINLVQRFT